MTRNRVVAWRAFPPEADAAARELAGQARHALGYLLVVPDELKPEYRGAPIFSGADLAKPVPALAWLIKGLWPAKSHGVLGAAKKTLKTYTAMALAVAVASGEPAFGEFEVPVAGPVLYVAGEGGEGPTRRRLQRMAKAYGVGLDGLPIHLTLPRASIEGEEFVETVRKALGDFRPVLVVVDPLYAFHPADVEQTDLTKRGPMFARLSALVTDTAALMVVDHFKKDVDKLDLSSTAGVGIAEWSDSWGLFRHKKTPDVEGGRFFIEAAFGSRQTGGREIDLDWEVGRFDEDDLDHIGDISWTVRTGAGRSSVGVTPNKEQKLAEACAAVVEMVRYAPDTYTKTAVRDRINKEGHPRVVVNEALVVLFRRGTLVQVNVPRVEGGVKPGETATKRTRMVLRVADGSGVVAENHADAGGKGGVVGAG